LSSRAVAELSKEERIIASAVSVAMATESTTDFLRGSRADSMRVGRSSGVLMDVRRSSISDDNVETFAASSPR
jgi:hypothetical protein